MSDETQKTDIIMDAEPAAAEAAEGGGEAVQGEQGEEQAGGQDIAAPRAASVFKSDDNKRAIVNGEIEILHDKPLPKYDSGEVKAYVAQAQGSEARQQIRLFAYVCEKHLVPRGRIANKLKGIINPSLCKFVGTGIVYWPPAKEQRYVMIYEDGLGKPIMDIKKTEGLGLRQDVLMSAVIKPMVNVFLDFRDSGIFHGNINPMNMYDGNANTLERVILGDCLASPPGYAQPLVFEPIERGMCDPIARGKGTVEDDLYAFGVSLTMILRTKDPLKGLSDDEILRQKIELGSYGALTGRERFTGGILELLRGLLYDDKRQRWSLDEVMLWLEGQRLSPKQSTQKKKASRPIHFNEKRYFRPQVLAMDIGEMQSEAAQLVDSGALEQWLTRSLEDKSTFTRYEQALESAQEQGRGPGYWNRLMGRISIALDPYSPMRYKHLAVHPEGFPYAFAKAVALKEDIAPYVELVNQQLLSYWLNVQVDVSIDFGGLISRYESSRAFLKQDNAGYGVERMLYYMLPDCPCMSDKLKDYYILNPEDLMYAFEEISHKKDRPALFLDRHITAFLSVKERKVVDNYLPEINAKESYKKILGNIKTLATLQKRSKMEMFPGITNWIADMLPPVYKRFHDRHLRVRLKEKVDKLRSSGNLTKIAALLENNNALHQDMVYFKQAMDEFKVLREEEEELKEKLKTPEIFGKEEGREYSAVFSLVLSVIVIVCFTFLFLTNDGKLF